MKLKIYGSALVALMLGFMASCTNDVTSPADTDNGQMTLKLAKTPDVRVWSGHETFSGTTKAAEDATEETVNQKYLNDEVEVNLAINDVHLDEAGAQKYNVADLCSKLSIHLRSAKDVKITIPVPESIYCDQDDLIILKNHLEDNFVYGGAPDNEVAMEIDGNTVTLKLTYSENAITVETSGMNADVLAYCRENYGDGLNFEVYNYFNRANMPLTDEDGNKIGGLVDTTKFDEWDVTDLKTALDNSTIEFVGGTPEYYINAFTGHTTLEAQGLEFIDCYVTPVENQIGEYVNVYYGPHFNGYEKNLIYSKKAKEEPKEGDKWVEETFEFTGVGDLFGVGKAEKESRPTVPAPKEDEPTGTTPEGELEGPEGE